MTIYRITAILLVVGSLSACVKEVEIENERAQVTSVGSLSLDVNQNVVVPFSIRDLEGDDQVVAIDICDAPGTNCGVAFEGGGDPIDRLPTIPKDTDVEHEFKWRPWCGRFVDNAFVPQDADAEFVVAVSVFPSDGDAVYSEPTTLTELGAIEATCE